MTGHRQTRDASVERPAGEMSMEDGAGNTVEENSSVFSLIRMR